jgi:hypothetical protein
MNRLREAVAALEFVRDRYPGLSIEITLEAYGPRVHATLNGVGLDRSVSWLDLETGNISVLAVCVYDVAGELSKCN